jgi:hypothetical protein
MIKQQPCQNRQSLIFKGFCHPLNHFIPPLMNTFMFHLLQNCFIGFYLKIDKRPVSAILKTGKRIEKHGEIREHRGEMMQGKGERMQQQGEKMQKKGKGMQKRGDLEGIFR